MTNAQNFLNETLGSDSTEDLTDEQTEQMADELEEVIEGPPSEIRGTIQTELFNLDLKAVTFGDNQVDATKGTLALQIIRSITHKIADMAAGRMVDVQAELFDPEVVIDRDCPPMSETFTNGGTVVEQYAENLPQASLIRAETLNAEFTALMMTLGQLGDEKARLFPYDQLPLSYAYDQSATSRQDRFITDVVEGVKFRAASHDSLLALKAKVTARPGQRQHSRKLPKTFLAGI